MIGDLHYGEKGDSDKHNDQTNDCLRWAVSEAKKRSCTTVVQFGDWFHNRNRVNVNTMNKGIEGAKILSDGFDHAYTIVSNHDIYHRDRLDVNSMAILRPYINVIDEPTELPEEACGGESSGVIMWPWVTSGKAWDSYINVSKGYRFLFAHLELNGFLMNDHYEMEHGYSPKELRDFEHVYTGHYHSPQTKDNISYLGIPFGVSMTEANRELGIYFLETKTGEVEFVPYGKVKVISIPYEEFDQVIEDLDPENTYIRVEFPDDLADETEITRVQKVLEEGNFKDSKIQYTETKTKQLLESDVEEVEEVENIDKVVRTNLSQSSKVEGIDNEILIRLYNKAAEMGEDDA